MNTPDILQSLLLLATNQDILFKIGLVLILIVYVLFALILARQIFLLNSTVNQISFSPIFNILVFVHLVAATGLLLFVLFLL